MTTVSIPPGCPKVFIHRDYSDGLAVKFEKKFPSELDGKVDPAVLDETISKLNAIYHEGEELSGQTYCEGFFQCITAYIVLCCMNTHYEKCIHKASRFIAQQNEEVYSPLGIVLIDPAERGLRVLEVCQVRGGAQTI